MSFFYICNPKIAKNFNRGIALKVVQSRGIEVNPQIDISVTDMISNKKDKTFKNFYNRGYGGITFNIQVIFKKDESQANAYSTSEYYPKKWRILNWVDYYIKNMKPLYVVTDAIDIKNGLYIITDNSRRVQTYKNYTVWDLEFTSFTGLNSVKFTNSNKAIKKVVKKYKKETAKKKKQAKSKRKSKLKKCKTSEMKYSKKKKTVKCVKYLQNVLYKDFGLLKKNNVDGWYGPKTLGAVLKFQISNRKKYKLHASGNVDKATLKALCK